MRVEAGALPPHPLTLNSQLSTRACPQTPPPRSWGGPKFPKRVDRLERLAAGLRRRVRGGRFAADAELAAIAGVAIADLRPLVTALGYRAIIEGEQEFFIGRPRRRGLPEKIRRRASPRDGHPFAKLKELNFA